MGDAFLEIFVPLFMVRFVAMEASYQRAKWTKSGLRFPVGIVLRVMLRVGGPFAVFSAYKMLEGGTTRSGVVVALLVVFIGIAGTFSRTVRFRQHQYLPSSSDLLHQ